MENLYNNKTIQNEYTFNLYNTLAPNGTLLALRKIIPYGENMPVILCIGSDLSVGDSLGPMCGTKIKDKLRGLNCFVYGTLARPITAHEVKYMNEFMKSTHPGSPVIAIDAAVGSSGDIGLIKLSRGGLRPGSGANKSLARVGDASIAEKTLFNFSILTATRLNIVYRMAEIMSEGVSTFLMDYMRRQNSLNTGKNSDVI